MLLGIDLGTSSLKTVLMNPAGQIVAQASGDYPLHVPQPGWAEQDPADWVNAAVHTMRRIISQCPEMKTRIRGISFSGQMHGLVVVGDDDKPLRPAIIWADQRSSQQVEFVYAKLGAEQLGKLTGNPLTTGFMLASWLWLQTHEPHIAKEAAWLLLPKDYLRFVLCGEIGSEASDAASTGLFDPFAGDWQSEICSIFHIPLKKLPLLHPSAEIAGTLRPAIAEQTGLPPGILVIFGAGDQAAQALANGVTHPDILSSTIGTGGQLFAPLASPRYDPQLRMHLFCHAIPHTWHLETAILSAGLSLRWLKETILENRYSYQQLADGASEIEHGAEGLFFLPDLAGNRTPHMDPNSRGAFTGLTLRHAPHHLARAIMEGVVLEMRQGYALMLSLGVTPRQIVASGGGTSHPLWLQLQADIYNRPIYRSQTPEAAAVGAAMLAGIGAGEYHSTDEAVETVVRWETDPTQPNPAQVQFYQAHYQRFIRLYPALQNITQESIE